MTDDERTARDREARDARDARDRERDRERERRDLEERDERPWSAWARLDPTGAAPHFVEALRALPGAGMAERAAAKAERALLKSLNERIVELEADPPANGDAPRLPPPVRTPAELLDALLTTSLDLTPAQSRERLHTLALERLIPDEARMLAALSDGSVYVLVHIAVSQRPGSQPRYTLENASNVGRAAGVSLPDRVPGYVTHLIALGLVETGPEDPSLATEYDILLTESPLIEARKKADRAGRLPGRVIRRTVRISDFGRELWETARPQP